MTQLLDSLGWALLHSLWQGALAFCLVVAFRNLWKNGTPSARYGFQLLALIGCFAAFLATFTLYMGSDGQSSGAVLNFIAGGGQAAPTALESGLASTAAGLTMPTHPAAYTPMLGLIWCLGFTFMAIRYSAAYILTQRLRRVGLSAIPPIWENRFRTLVLNSGLNENIRLFVSSRVTGPLTVGFIKPLVLVPAGFLTGLPREQVEAILLHELAHIRRYDYLFNLIQTAIKTVFFFHPAIHYISKQIDMDREEACDDLAVAQTRNPQALARGLAALQLCTHEHEFTSEFAMAAKGADMPLLGRLKRLAGTAEEQRRPEHLMMALLTTLLIGGIYLGTSGAANAHPEPSDDVETYEHAKASKHNYKFKNTRLNGKSVTLKITEDGRRWVMANGQWIDVDMSPEVLQWVPEMPEPPKFKALGGIENAGKYNAYDFGFDDKMDQFQIDMEYFEASMERYTDEMDHLDDRKTERAIEKAEREAERAERDAERMADRMEAARDRTDEKRDREEYARDRAENKAEHLREQAEARAEHRREYAEAQAERQQERAEQHAERQRERMEDHAERQREKAFEQAEHEREKAERKAEYQREHTQKHADKTHAKYNALRDKLYTQLLDDGLIASRKEKVTFRFKDNHWVANGIRVPSATENHYCQIMSDMGIKKASLTKLEISEKSTHLVTTSKDGKDRQSHSITVGEFKPKKVKTKAVGVHKHKDGSIHDPAKEAHLTPVVEPVPPVIPDPVTVNVRPINFEVETPVFVMPTQNARVTAKYGMSSALWPKTHQGIDLAAKTGTPVFAAADGKVKLMTTEDAWGHRIILEHEDGFQTIYGHLNSFNVTRGQTVKAGDVIAGVGSTGRSTGPHLHFEIRKGGETIDPKNLIF